ncbi:hypothetical protein M0R45_007048 [Rubus argutus]|uniref:Transposase MuDR plant domain-containing protein n=1 Tax=Rubus argutus TaxID=59490 RepID=A0AAW1YTP6_RUBAR
MYHGGCIRNNNYVGGKVDFYDNVDKDRMSLVEVDNMVMRLNQDYEGHKIDYWFKIGHEDDALTKISSDADVMTMCCCVPVIRLVILYLDHIDVIKELAEKPMKTMSPRPLKRSRGIVIRDVEDNVSTQQSKAPVVDPKDKGKHKMRDYGNKEEFFGVNFDSLQDIDVLDYMQSFGGVLEAKDRYDETRDDYGSQDADYIPQFADAEYDDYGIDNDEGFEGVEIEDGSNATTLVVEYSQGLGVEKGVQENDQEFEDNEDMFGGQDSDEERLGKSINSDGEFEDDFQEFNPKTDMKNPVFVKGMKFATIQVLRDALRERAIQDGWEYTYIKNDRSRLRVICKENDCPFELFASKMQHESTLMIKTYEPEHRCSRKFENNMVRVKYLTRRFMDQIKLNANWNTGNYT